MFIFNIPPLCSECVILIVFSLLWLILHFSKVPTALSLWVSLCVSVSSSGKKTARVKDSSAYLGQRVEDPIQFGQRYESLIRLMNAIAHLC